MSGPSNAEPVEPVEQAESAAPVDLAVDRIRRHVPALLSYFVRRVADREDAADLLGDTLLAAWRRIDALPADDDEARMWLYGVAAHVLNNGRRTVRRRTALADRLRGALSIAPPPSQERAELRIDVERALGALAPRDRELVRLVHWDGLALAEAAQVLGLNASTARTRYARARARLAKALGAADPDDVAHARGAAGPAGHDARIEEATAGV